MADSMGVSGQADHKLFAAVQTVQWLTCVDAHPPHTQTQIPIDTHRSLFNGTAETMALHKTQPSHSTSAYECVLRNYTRARWRGTKMEMVARLHNGHYCAISRRNHCRHRDRDMLAHTKTSVCITLVALWEKPSLFF